MGYLLSSNSIQPAGGGKQPFLTADAPAMQEVVLDGAACAASAAK